MKTLLHLIATPRGDESNTLQVSRAFLESFRAAHPDWDVDELDLSATELPDLTVKRVDGKYVLLEGRELYGDMKESWSEILAHIGRFLAADAYLVSTPMWNFAIPYTLKHYLDVIVQPHHLFRYTATGSEGLVKKRPMTVITSRGGTYATGDAKAADFQEPYLRFIFGFVGIQDIRFIHAEPMDMGGERRKEALASAMQKAADAGRN